MMAKLLVETLVRPDGRLKIELHRDADGTYRYIIVEWFDKDPDNPHEPEHGYWTPTRQSGIFGSMTDAKREALLLSGMGSGDEI